MLCLFPGPKIGRVRLEKVIRLRGMSPRHIMKGRRSDIVGLALADQAVVLQEVLLFGFVAFALRGQNPLGFASSLFVSPKRNDTCGNA